jgi:hypothetical protein
MPCCEKACGDGMFSINGREDVDVGKPGLALLLDVLEPGVSSTVCFEVPGDSRRGDDLKSLTTRVSFLKRVQHRAFDRPGPVHGDDDTAGTIGIHVRRRDDDNRAVGLESHLPGDLAAGERGEPGDLVATDHEHACLAGLECEDLGRIGMPMRAVAPDLDVVDFG